LVALRFRRLIAVVSKPLREAVKSIGSGPKIQESEPAARRSLFRLEEGIDKGSGGGAADDH